ncbi:DUF3231 family protein [Pelotomaculum propionicicum]|uniref:DUF3231 family protein n=1 Tax=Pelotomaculum propionicicum TaxID=258475 RepID=UPI003B7F9EDB
MEIIQNNTGPSPYHDIEAVHTAAANQQDTRLTSAELANLWSSWMESSIKKQIVKYFLKIVEDPDIKDVLEYTLGIAKKHLRIISEIYSLEKHPAPIGFTDGDLNLEAPRLFSDTFVLRFLEGMARIRLDGYSTALQMSTRADVRKYFTECVADPAEIYNRAVSLMLSKGMYTRPPYIPVPERIDFVKKQNYLAGYLGKQRTLNSIEISHIFSSLQRNSLRKAMLKGFGQVAQSEKVRQYMDRGWEIANKHVEIFSSLLIKNNLPVSMPWDNGVMKSNIAPFSDKLMMQQLRSSNVVLTSAYGKALPVVRIDIVADFSRLTAEVLKYLDDGVNVLIENGWLEEPPQLPDKKH